MGWKGRRQHGASKCEIMSAESNHHSRGRRTEGSGVITLRKGFRGEALESWAQAGYRRDSDQMLPVTPELAGATPQSQDWDVWAHVRRDSAAWAGTLEGVQWGWFWKRDHRCWSQSLLQAQHTGRSKPSAFFCLPLYLQGSLLNNLIRIQLVKEKCNLQSPRASITKQSIERWDRSWETHLITSTYVIHVESFGVLIMCYKNQVFALAMYKATSFSLRN